MTNQSKKGRIRPIAVCVFRNGNRILVEQGYDPVKDETFYRPLGGGIHFGEPSEAALRREIHEELGVEIRDPKRLGVLENLFTFNGEPGHEIVFVYDAQFADAALYDAAVLKGRESGGEPIHARWLDLGSVGPDTPPLYPEGLLKLLRSAR